MLKGGQFDEWVFGRNFFNNCKAPSHVFCDMLCFSQDGVVHVPTTCTRSYCSNKFLLLCLWPYESHRRKRLSNNVRMGQEAPGQMSVAGLSPRDLVLSYMIVDDRYAKNLMEIQQVWHLPGTLPGFSMAFP